MPTNITAGLLHFTLETAKENMKFVTLIPLRGGSKSIPRKNVKLLAGKPMAAWAIQAANDALTSGKVYVSTDCPEIAQMVESLNLGVEVINRPAHLATDEASTESVMAHFMSLVDFDALITIQATSPLLLASDIDTATSKFENEKLDSLLSAVRTKRFFWSDDGNPINYDPLSRPRRQDFRGTLMENGAFYITSRKVLETTGCRLASNIGVFEMDSASAVEIDEPDDWGIVEKVLMARLKIN